MIKLTALLLLIIATAISAPVVADTSPAENQAEPGGLIMTDSYECHLSSSALCSTDCPACCDNQCTYPNDTDTDSSVSISTTMCP